MELVKLEQETLESMNKKIQEIKDQKRLCFENCQALAAIETELIALKIEKLVKGEI